MARNDAEKSQGKWRIEVKFIVGCPAQVAGVF
jgi:hypothetical protein